MLSGYTFYNSSGIKTNGTYIPIDTSDANAMTRNIETGYSAYVNGIKINGSASIYHGIVKYTGTIEPLSLGRENLAATSIGDYALFAGGHPSGTNYNNTVDTYNLSFTKSTALDMSNGGNYSSATSIPGHYALISGALSKDTMNAYDLLLTKSLAPDLYQNNYISSTSTGDYALFGCANSSTTSTNMDVYDISLIKTRITLQSGGGRYKSATTSINNYALFGGGYATNASGKVDAFDTSLVLYRLSDLIEERFFLSAATVGNYVLFAGGYHNTGSGMEVSLIDIYDTSLTKVNISYLSSPRGELIATSINNYALFGGGSTSGGIYGSSGIDTVEIFDTNLTKSLNTLNQKRTCASATAINNYALFGGGSYVLYEKSGSSLINTKYYADSVEAFYEA